ncbi:MAG TPA: MTH938/NDUFAF3 family protein [Dongiaceae bacterium]|jgi:uncharacterized protein|nr:MTH938/NDUFAF3 family protein [Dongiaceae bacterium]
MDVTPLIPAGRMIIEAYGNGGFRVSGQRHEGNLLVFPGRTLPWKVLTFVHLSGEDFASVLTAGRAGEVELLLLGTGATLAPVASPIKAVLREAGIVVEPMDTGAACRTYNVLLAEERKIAAALIAI